MIILKSKNSSDFEAVLERLKAKSIHISELCAPTYFQIEKEQPFFKKLPLVVVAGLLLGVLGVWLINSVWIHQVGSKPTNLSGIIGWGPVIFEVTILITALFYLIKFLRMISEVNNFDDMELDSNYYYCFVEPKDDAEKAFLLKNFDIEQITE